MLELKSVRTCLLRVAFSCAILFTSSSHANPDTFQIRPIQIQTLRSYSRLEIQLSPGVQKEWKDVAGGFEILLKDITLTDLGAPLGSEKDWVQQFELISDERLERVQVEEVRDGVKIIGKWKFLTGEKSPDEKIMEHFDFNKTEGSSYVIDFWQKMGPSVAEVRARKRREQELANLKKAEKKAHQRAERRVAQVKQVEEVTDLERYCKEPLSEKNDVFLPFKPVHREFDFTQWIPLTTADVEYPYLNPEGDSKESQYARLALKLYRSGKPALAVKATDFLEKEYPKSTFLHEMKFLRANSFLRLGYKEKAYELLEHLVLNARGSPVSLYSGIFLAATKFQNHDYLNALERFYWLIKNFPEHRLRWILHFGAAESLYAIEQVNRAAKEYEWIMENAPSTKAQSEAGLRLGDLYLQRQHYAQALATYFKGLKYFEKDAENFPQIHINRAETLYWLSDWDRSAEAFKTFLNKFPSDPMGWRATYRLGEIYARKADTASLGESRKWHLETLNRFPYSPGAVLSSLRLAPCGDHAGFTQDSFERFIGEKAIKFSAPDDMFMADYPDYRYLSQIRTLIALQQQELAVQVAASTFDIRLKSETKKNISELFKNSLRKSVLEMLDVGEKFEAIAFFNKYGSLIPDDEHRLVPDFVLKLSQAASDLEFGFLSQKLFKTYAKMLEGQSSGRAIAAADSDINDGLDERLKKSEENFTLAKAHWIASGLTAEEEVRKKLAQVYDESPQSFEKEVILALIEERKGNFKESLSHATRARLLVSNVTGINQFQFLFWISVLSGQTGDIDLSIEGFKKVRTFLTADAAAVKAADRQQDRLAVLGVPRLPSEKDLFIFEAKMNEQKKNWNQAADTYAAAIEKGLTDDRISFSYARALRKTEKDENVKKSDEVLKELASKSKDAFWKNMASNMLVGKEN